MQDPRHVKVFHNFLTFGKKERKQKSKSLGHRERERRVREKYIYVDNRLVPKEYVLHSSFKFLDFFMLSPT